MDQRLRDTAIAQETEKREAMAWLALAERAFAFWDKQEDLLWDNAPLHLSRQATLAVTRANEPFIQVVPTMARSRGRSDARSPFLRRVYMPEPPPEPRAFPFTVPAFAEGISIDFKTPVTFFVGENGSGKSTLLEAIGHACGFNLQG